MAGLIPSNLQMRIIDHILGWIRSRGHRLQGTRSDHYSTETGLIPCPLDYKSDALTTTLPREVRNLIGFPLFTDGTIQGPLSTSVVQQLRHLRRPLQDDRPIAAAR
uniref:Uncharacterized protein n=1 Tax=Cacopsylla melanoneura TaxID=428564 RepID=A0A8D8Z092_9HEMI